MKHTGEGGTGKTFLLHTIKQYLRDNYQRGFGIYRRCIALAPTGIAAFNVKGYTLHAFLHLPVNSLDESIPKTFATSVSLWVVEFYLF
jgi:hypothetical protein